MFSANMPNVVKQNVDTLNSSKTLKMGPDNNTFGKVYKRIKRSHQFGEYFNIFLTVLINIWFIVISNFQIIIYNYFAPMICILI